MNNPPPLKIDLNKIYEEVFLANQRLEKIADGLSAANVGILLDPGPIHQEILQVKRRTNQTWFMILGVSVLLLIAMFLEIIL